MQKNGNDNYPLVLITSGLDIDTPNFLSNIIKILLGGSSGNIYVIASRSPISKKSFDERVYIKHIMPENENERLSSSWRRIAKYILTQLRISYVLAKERKAEAYIVFLAQSLTLPILTLKLMRQKVILAVGASYSELARSRKDRLLVFSKIEEKISYRLVDRIVVYSECLINKWNLEKYGNKISIAHEHLLDFDKFKMQRQLNEREKLVGYVGRLSEEKGVLNFVRAILELSKGISGVEFLIGGDGRLRGEIEKYLSEESLKGKVELPGWIPHDELPGYLNQLKLLVLPSYTEGLPNIMLEAMACGTPILATPVGAIPDIIKEGETGFLMENNSPECIATNVIRALDHPDLEGIAQRARSLVEREFTFERAVERWREILEDVCDDRR